MKHETRLQPTQVLDMAKAAPPTTCSECAPFASAGWESFPSARTDAPLVRKGALWLPGDEEPTLEEWRPVGVDHWSPDAPIALAYHPYNRCEVWACRACGHLFVRYTEYGGYYEDQRIRELQTRLVVA